MTDPGAGLVAGQDPPSPPRVGGRRTFGRVVLLGLAGAGLAAVAGHRPWVGVSASDDQAQSLATAALPPGSAVAESPAAGALALVVLAAWGVLLVTRGRVRRAVAVVACLAATGLVVAVVLGHGQVIDAVRTAVGDVGAPVEVVRTGWYWATGVGAVVSLVATALAVRLVPSWPEMGTRYDSPADAVDARRAARSHGAAAADPTDPADPVDPDQSNLELWKSIDEGHDPTR